MLVALSLLTWVTGWSPILRGLVGEMASPVGLIWWSPLTRGLRRHKSQAWERKGFTPAPAGFPGIHPGIDIKREIPPPTPPPVVAGGRLFQRMSKSALALASASLTLS